MASDRYDEQARKLGHELDRHGADIHDHDHYTMLAAALRTTVQAERDRILAIIDATLSECTPPLVNNASAVVRQNLTLIRDELRSRIEKDGPL